MKRHGHLFEDVIDYGNLLAAAHRARRGKRDRVEVARFVFDLEPNLLQLQEELRSGSYRMRPYRSFVIREPKRRRICAAHFRDRVVQHAICAVLDPIFDRCLIDDTYACRRGKGTHAAVRRMQHFSRRFRHVLLCDVRRYFEAVDHDVLKSLCRRKLKDRALLSLLDRIIDHPLPGAEPGKGVPIGNLTSQHFANLYLGELDHFVKDRLRLPAYLRYMDDCAAFSGGKPELQQGLAAIREFLHATLRLELREERTLLAPVTQGVPFLGFRVFRAWCGSMAESWRGCGARCASARPRTAWDGSTSRNSRNPCEAWSAMWAISIPCRPASSCLRCPWGWGDRRVRLEPGEPGRQLEQQRQELPGAESQQRPARQPQQQPGLPPAEHAAAPEGAVQGPHPRASAVSRRSIPLRREAGRTPTARGAW